MGATTPDTELRPGLNVAIHGLKGAADLNGKEGKCKHWDADKGRWTVELPGGELKALKPENLQAKPASMTNWVVGAAAVVLMALFVQQSGLLGQMGASSPVGYVTELFAPFDPPPPKAPKDTVVISFCQG
eukprot:TRINITY_DN26739_c0_g1_i1.p1 TRINITY_DN26739_c0_g1~~TRINITY_DN26739_c0_g1_i1.p1  ORF type:complete len:130 (-),score=20.73 TRINITY_DN26739_c0_g1_i1:525-914(-)